MANSHPLRVGLFGIGLEAYWPQFEGLKPKLEGYLGQVAGKLGRPGVEVCNLGLVDSPEKAMEAGHAMRRNDVDIIFLHVTTYALSSTVLPVVQRAKAPVIILNLQPVAAMDYQKFNKMGDRTKMTGEWLAHCGACPVPEIANAFNRSRIGFHQVTGTLQPKDPAWKEIDDWIEAAPFDPRTATVLWENMVAPLIPYTARGVIWYQGESNTGEPDKYRLLVPALIAAWRQAWDRPDWPFFFVQLASVETPPTQDWPGLRAAQSFTRDTVPHTGMAVAIDAGERDKLHPKFKKPVGERLARLALAQVYGRNMAARRPLMTKAVKQDGTITATFDHTGAGLQTPDGKPEVPSFEVAGRDGKFHAATARLAGPAGVALECADVTEPVSVRYAWSDWIEPPATLQNPDGLPAESAEVRLP